MALTLYIYCAGGFGKEVFDTASKIYSVTSPTTEIKFVDDMLEANYHYESSVITFKDVLDCDGLSTGRFIIASGEPEVRRVVREKLLSFGACFTNLIDPSSIVSTTAVLEEGVIITRLCSISSAVHLRENSCVNTMSIVAHDVRVGENSVVSSMVNMGGACEVGNDSYIGMGALIKEGVRIGSNSIIGMGSVVYQDVPSGVIALGNPARVVRKNVEKRVFKR